MGERMTDTTQTPAPAPKTCPCWWPQMRDVLAMASTALFAFAMIAPAVIKGAAIDQELRGAIILQWGLVMGFYFGTSKGSAAKDETIAAMAPTAK